MRSSWATIKKECSKQKNVGGLPGMSAVLHTFGSKMNYHVHVHALVTFGGIDENGKWKKPKKSTRLSRFETMCKTFKKIMLAQIRQAIKNGKIKPFAHTEQTLVDIEKKRWNVRAHHPTMSTKTLEEYLSRYINRVAITKSRLTYIYNQEKKASMVGITYNDYKNQKEGEPAPKGYKELEPLLAIHQFMQHVLPRYFQKSRHYGLHSATTYRKWKDKLDHQIKATDIGIKELFQIIKRKYKQEEPKCEKCGHSEFEITGVPADKDWIHTFIFVPGYRGPPAPITPHRTAPKF